MVPGSALVLHEPEAPASSQQAALMTVPGAIKPTHKAVKAYYEALAAYAGQGVTHEGATETAFQRLLEAAAKTYGWALVPKLGIKHRGKHVTPDGTVRDANFLHRGYWEAKDTDDDLEVEIRKKIAKGYPLTNIIFEGTTRESPRIAVEQARSHA